MEKNKKYVSEIEKVSLIVMEKVNKEMKLEGKELKKLQIGITIILINIWKISIVVVVALITGLVKEVMISVIAYSWLRLYSFGIHASKDYICTIVTILIHIGNGMISHRFALNNNSIVLIFFILTILIYKYAPADTRKHPILGEKNRQALKKKSILCIIVIAIITIISSNNIIKNILLVSTIIQTITILPITYKLCGEDYKNYEKYE